jgi:hypothetical protein
MRNLSAFGWKLTLALLCVMPLGLSAQEIPAAGNPNQNDNTGFGTASGEFLLLGAGARGNALGGAFAAIATDVSALYYNPAGIAMIDKAGVMLGTQDYIASTRYSWGGAAFPFAGGSRTIGFQIGTFGFKDQPVYTEEQPDGNGATYSVSETFIGGTFAQNFSDRFSAGLTLKYVNDKLGTVSGNAFGVDFGTNFHASLNDHPVKFSFTLANLGSNLSYKGTGVRGGVPRTPIPGQDEVPTLPQQADLSTKGFPLPTIFRVGLAYDLLSQENNRLTVLGDFNQPNANKPGFVFGGEWASSKLGGSSFGFAVRGSYSYYGGNHIDLTSASTTGLNDEENLEGMAFGGGINYGYGTEGFSLGLDYAYKYLGILGPTNFFSLSLGW